MESDNGLIEKIIFYERSKVLIDTNKDAPGLGRRQTFEIGDTERLIGCELHLSVCGLAGIRFVKWTVW